MAAPALGHGAFVALRLRELADVERELAALRERGEVPGPELVEREAWLRRYLGRPSAGEKKEAT